MNPAAYNITIYRGADYSLHIRHQSAGVNTDLTGYKAVARIRHDDKVGTLSDPAFTATTENGRITLSADGKIAIAIPNLATAAIGAISEGVWGLDIIDPLGKVIPLLRGAVKIKPQITNP